jgi:hypothetical protein
MVARTRLNVMLYVHCLFFLVFLLLLQFQFNLFEFYTSLDETLIIATNNGAVFTAIW